MILHSREKGQKTECLNTQPNQKQCRRIYKQLERETRQFPKYKNIYFPTLHPFLSLEITLTNTKLKAQYLAGNTKSVQVQSFSSKYRGHLEPTSSKGPDSAPEGLP